MRLAFPFLLLAWIGGQKIGAMRSMTSRLALCAALILGVSACKAGDDAAEKEKRAEKVQVASAAAGDGDAVAAGAEKAGAEKAGAEKAAEKVPAAEDKGADLAGDYRSGEITLTISNVTRTDFDFRVSSPIAGGADEEDDPCGGIDYKGRARFDESDAAMATTEHEGSLRFTEGGVHFEPSMDMIGNDCMRQIDVEFKKAAT